MALQKIGLATVLDDQGFGKGSAAYNKAIKGMEENTDRAAKGIGAGLKKIAQFAAGNLLAGGIQGLAQQTIEMVKAAGQIPGVAGAFEGLGGSIERMREASLGMVTDIELMKTFNSAAQLVSTDFAQKLPDAMSMLSKVSAATGEDMGFMLDSLVKGVGRLSPMILDNLGIQVNLTEANEAYAASIGKSAKDLTKAEQQTAVMNMTMEKLAINTASMPSIAGTAGQQMASFGVQVQNLRNDIGVALLPVMSAVMSVMAQLASKVFPLLVKAAQGLSSALMAVWNAGSRFGGLVAEIGGLLPGFVKEFVALKDSGFDPLRRAWVAFINVLGGERFFQLKAHFDAARKSVEELISKALNPVQTAFELLEGKVPTPVLFRLAQAVYRVRDAFINAVGFAKEFIGSLDITLPQLPDLSTLFTQGASAGGGLIDAIIGSDPAQLLMDRLSGLAEPIITAVTTTFEEVKAALSSGDAGGVLAALFGGAQEIGPLIAGLKPKLIGVAFELADSLAVALAEAFPDLAPTIEEFIRPALDIGKRLAGLFFDAQKLVKGAVMKIGESIGGTLLESLPDVMNILGKLGTLFESTFRSLLPVVTTAITTIGSIFERVFPVVLSTVQRVIPVVQSIIENMAPVVVKAIQIVGNIFEKVVPFAMDLIARMAEFIGSKMPQIAAIITAALEAIKIVFDTVWPAVQVIVEVAWTAIQSLISGALNIIQHIINTVLAVLQGDWDAAWQAIKQVPGEVLTAVAGVLGGILDGILKIFGTNKEDLWTTITETWEGLKSKIETKAGEIVSAITTKVAEWTKPVRNLIATFKGLGEDIMGGLKAGLEAAWSNVEQVFTKLIELLPAWAQKLLKSESPSQVFWDIGADIMEGLANGMSDSEAKVLKIIADAVEDFIEAFDQFVRTIQLAQDMSIEPDSFFSLQWLENFAGAITSILEEVKNALAAYKEGDIKRWKGKLSELVGVIEALASSMEAIAKITGNLDLDANVFDEAFFTVTLSGLRDDLARVAGILAELTTTVTNETAKAQAEFWAATNALVTNFVAGAEALSQLVSLDLGVEMEGGWEAFESALLQTKEDLERVAGMLDDLATTTDTKATAAAGEWYNAIQGAISGFLTAFEGLKRLSEVAWVRPSQVEWLTMQLSIRAMNLYLEALAPLLDAGTEALTAIVTNSAAFYGAIADAVSGFIAAFQGLYNLTTASWMGPTRLQWLTMQLTIRAIKVNLEALVPLLEAGTEASTTIATTSGAFYSAVDQAISGFLEAMDELKALTEAAWMGPTRLEWLTIELTIQAIKVNLEALVPLLEAGTEALTTIATTSGTFYGAVSGVIEGFLSAFANLKELAKAAWMGPTRLEWFTMQLTIQAIKINLEALVPLLEAGTEELITLATASAGFYDAANAVIGGFLAAFQALKEFYSTDYALPNVLERSGWIDDLRLAIEGLATGLSTLSPDLDVDAVSAAAEFYSDVQTIIGIVKPALEALRALALYVPYLRLPEAMENFKTDLTTLVTKLREVADSFMGTGEEPTGPMEASAAIATAIGTMIGIVKPAIDAVKALLGYTSSVNLPQELADFEADLRLVIGSIKRLADDYRDSLINAEAFATTAGTIIGLIEPTLQALAALVSQNSEDYEAAMDTFERTVGDIINTINRVQGDMWTYGVPHAKAFEAAALAVKNAIEKALSYLNVTFEPFFTRGASSLGHLIASLGELEDKGGGALKRFRNGAVSDFNDITTAVRALITEVGALNRALDDVDVPPELEGHSPPPLADWMGQVADQAERAGSAMRRLMMPQPMLIPARVYRGAGAGGGTTTNNNAAVNIYNPSMRSDADMVAIESRIEHTVLRALRRKV